MNPATNSQMTRSSPKRTTVFLNEEERALVWTHVNSLDFQQMDLLAQSEHYVNSIYNDVSPALPNSSPITLSISHHHPLLFFEFQTPQVSWPFGLFCVEDACN